MHRRFPVIASVLALGLIAGVAHSGGRARVSILSIPKQIEAGKPIEITLAVKPEWPASQSRNVEPIIKAVCGEREVTCVAVPLKSSGKYAANLTLPAEGDWAIHVDSRYCETRMTPLTLRVKKPTS